MNQFYTSLTILVLCVACTQKSGTVYLIDRTNFQEQVDDKDVDLFTLKNEYGFTVQITNYGGRVVSLWAPDENGDFADVVLGYESLQGYLASSEIYFGALIGRYGNRINKGQFTLQDSSYSLATNNGDHHLHGGDKGFNNVVWDATQVSEAKLKLHYLSKDGEEGYPGNLDMVVTYQVTDDNQLVIKYKAQTDQATPVNLTHHSFFNLHGAGRGTINDHILQINASNYTPVVEGLIPTGKIIEVANTPFDFTSPVQIGSRVNHNHQQLNYGFGYDHNFVLDGDGMKLAATVIDPSSGRKMEVFTDEPGLQFYGGNFLNGQDKGKKGLSYQYRSAFCLETQHFPDSPNQAHFPATILEPGDTYTSTCIYKFTVEQPN